MVSSNRNKLFGVLPGSEVFKKLDNFLTLHDIKIHRLHVLYYPMTDETSYTVRNFICAHCESININFDASSGTETAGGHDFGTLVTDLNLSDSPQGYNVDQQLNNHFNDSLNNNSENDDSKNTKIKSETIDWNSTRADFASGVKEKINRLIVSYNNECKDDYIITSISHLQNWVSLNHNNKSLHVQIDRGATTTVPPTMISYLQAMVHDDQGMKFSLGLGLNGGKLGFQFQSLSFAISKLKYTVGDNDTGLYWVNGLPNLKKLELVWDTSSSKNIQIAFIAPCPIRHLVLVGLPQSVPLLIHNLAKLNRLRLVNSYVTTDFVNSIPETVLNMFLYNCTFESNSISLPLQIISLTLLTYSSTLPQISNSSSLISLSYVDVQLWMNRSAGDDDFIPVQSVQDFIISLPPALDTFRLYIDPALPLPANSFSSIMLTKT
ncbi:unnamed protein product [Ambrosiozyma monospora]|uniref:Unnamed protein product n=1 Tax=Ambrosiozyma monospora TaxID=43982 RepID=A0ACB5TCI2_AMBMO|nr:unnamed protein product [Ambrosiozyma monospora]